MIKYFCDRCEKELKQDDFSVTIKLDREHKIFVSVLAVDENNKPKPHVCHICIQEIIIDGEDVTSINPRHLENRIAAQPMVVPQPPPNAPQTGDAQGKVALATLQEKPKPIFQPVKPAILPESSTE